MKRSTARAAAAAAVVVGCGLVALVIAYYAQASSEAGLLTRTGPAVVWGLPIAKLVFNVAAACTIGSLMLALFALPPKGKAFSQALTFAGISAGLWTGASAAMSFLTFHSLANLALFSEGSGAAFISFLVDVDAGRRGALSLLLAATVTLLCFAARRHREVSLAALLSFAGLVPLALNSHATGSGSHPDSAVSVVMHMASAAVWLGGLLALVVLRRTLDAAMFTTVVRRYSTLALVSFVALAVSGLLAGWAGVGTLAALATPYGGILAAKSAAFIVLGVFGMLHRRWVIAKLEHAPRKGARAFTVLAVAELAVMGAASGLAAALARTPPPTIAEAAPAEQTPQIPSIIEALSTWRPDPLWSLVCGLAVFLYLAGLRRLRLRGGSWPAYRTALWLFGIAVLFVVTNGGLHAAQENLISAHVLTQMTITAVVPLLLVPAAPLSLAEQTITRRNDGSRGAAEAMDAVVRPILKATGDPLVPALGLAATLTLLYYTPLLEYSSSTQFGYAAMTILALLAGCLFTASVTRAFSRSASPTVAARLLALGGAAVLYSFHGWALAQQPDQLPDARRQPWQISVDPAFGIPSVGDAEPAGVAMWLIAAGSLLVAAAVVLFSARHKAGPLREARGSNAASRELVTASGPAAVTNPAFQSRPEGPPTAGRALTNVPLDP